MCLGEDARTALFPLLHPRKTKFHESLFSFGQLGKQNASVRFPKALPNIGQLISRQMTHQTVLLRSSLLGSRLLPAMGFFPYQCLPAYSIYTTGAETVLRSLIFSMPFLQLVKKKKNFFQRKKKT